MYCYYCKDFKNKEVSVIGDGQFCNESEHELWADKTYGKRGEKKVTHTVEFMQARLREMAKEVKSMPVSDERR